MSELCRSNVPFDLTVNRIGNFTQHRVILITDKYYVIQKRNVRPNLTNKTGKTVCQWRTVNRSFNESLKDIMFEFAVLTETEAMKHERIIKGWE